MDFETLEFSLDEHVATVTLNRPDRMNAFTQQMMDEFSRIYEHVRLTDDIHVMVLRAAGDRAFCTGVDVKEHRLARAFHSNLYTQEDPGLQLSPKLNNVWKPMVCAVHGLAAGGAFYWINEADIVICSEDAQFFDPHVTYGLTAALEPIGLTRRVPLGEALRVALLGLDERMSAERALQIGLVSEVVPREELWARADELAKIIAAKPPAAIQGTVRAIWESLDMTRTQALQTGLTYVQLGRYVGQAESDRATVQRPKPHIR